MADISKKEQYYIQLKLGLAFSQLLERNKKLNSKYIESGKENITLNHSLHDISNDTGFRVATLSAIFSGKSNPKAVTIDQILRSMGKDFTELAECYDKIEEADIEKFKQQLKAAKTKRKNTLVRKDK